MLPTNTRRRPETGFLLLPKSYILLGAAFCFIFGCLIGGGFKQVSYTAAANANTGNDNQIKAVPNALENPNPPRVYQAEQPLVSLSKPTVLVTGGLGFIGSHVVEELLDNNYNVVVFDDMSNGRNINRQTNAILVRDITVVDDFKMITHQIDYIVHLAAAISVSESTRLPEKYERINVEGSRKVFEWALKNGVKRVVAASSGATYGVPTPEEIPLREPNAKGGISPYATSKFKMEGLMKEYSEKGLPSIALRFFNVYGPRQDPKSDYSGVISWFMDKAKEGEGAALKVTGTGDQYRDFVFVKDVALAIRTAMESSLPGFDVFNVCTGIKTTINDLAAKVVQVFQSKATITHIEARPGDVLESVCDPTKSATILKFKSTYSLEQGMTKTKEWFMSLP